MARGETRGTGKPGGERLVAAVRSTGRTLRADLFTAARDPLPRNGWLGWLPHVHVLLFAVAMGGFNLNDCEQYADTAIVLLLVVLQSAALVLALSRPVAAWWLSTLTLFLTAEVVEAVVHRDMHWPWSAWGIALHTLVLLLLALRVPPRIAAAALGITVLSGIVNVAHAGHDHNQVVERGTIAFATAVVVGASLRIGRVARTRLVEQEVLTAEERSARALLEERNRIARELHDVVAHHMSVISIQAQVAPHLVENPPDELRENLAGIRQNAVEALTELRRVLDVLRSEDPAAEGVRHAPQPTLARLPELVDNVRGAGLTVTTEVTGDPRPLSPGVELSAFRIVQEALSNAMRHSPGARVRVAVGHQRSGVTVRVTNTEPDRPVAPSPGAGHGLLGMRERAAMLGGELAAGPTPDGGYEVTAILPARTNDAVHTDHPEPSAAEPVEGAP
ncbi:sensor histidine kinase [Streptomyces sp. NPDC059909]|uniref:sensor histidine kinase n=1 Tax=Streptomyces sp. NPDC059909 TaxID=3346998 RepID=UPI00364E8E94